MVGRTGELILDTETHSVDADFILTWIATALLLLYNIKRIGKIKYWTLFGLALIYFFSYYVSPINLVQPESSNESTPIVIFFLLFNTYSITIGGLEAYHFVMGFCYIRIYWFSSRGRLNENVAPLPSGLFSPQILPP
jgi:hypothetical protein